MADGPKENTHIRLEFVGGKSAKFWEITVEGASHTVRYGRLGTEGRSLTKEFDSPKEAQASAARQVSKKKQKGYAEVEAEESGDEASLASGAHSLADAELLPEDEALERLPIRQHVHSWGEEIQYVPGDLHVDGDLEFDDVPDLFVDGDLTVAGSIRNRDGDSGPFLIVTGDLEARNVVGGGSEVVVLGDARVHNTVFGHYNHGSIKFGGDVAATAVISEEHPIEIGGSVDGLCASTNRAAFTLAKYDYDDLGRVLVSEVFDDDGRLDEGALIRWICDEGESPVRGEAKTSGELAAERVAMQDEPIVLNLAGQKLADLPDDVTRLTTLRALDVSSNDIRQLPDALGNLSELRDLGICSLQLDELPDGLAKLKKLEILDMRRTDVLLPDWFGELSSLRVLRIDENTHPLPDSFAELGALEELAMNGASWSRRQEFPSVVTRIRSLRKLTVSGHAFASIPPELATLEQLEELDVCGSLTRIEQFPDLVGLPHLKRLRFSGKTGHTADPPPARRLIEDIMQLGSLEHLQLDRWGPKSGREGSLELPDRFDELPNLRTIDLSFNDLRSLPESFFGLQHLEAANFRYNRELPAEVCERLIETFPDATFNFERVDSIKADEVNPRVDEVTGKLENAERWLPKERWKTARNGFVKAMKVIDRGAPVSTYDRMRAYHGLVVALRNLYRTSGAEEVSTDDVIDAADQALAAVPPPIWELSRLGRLKRDVIRTSCIAIAECLLDEERDLDRAVDLIQRASSLIDEIDDTEALQVKVRVLRALGRADDGDEVARWLRSTRS